MCNAGMIYDIHQDLFFTLVMQHPAEPCSWRFSSLQNPSQMQQQKTCCSHFSLQGLVARLEFPGAG